MTVRRSLTVLAATMLVGALSLLTAPSALAATFIVTRFDDPAPGNCDPNDCSLREAVLAANMSVGIADTIQLAAGTYTLSIPGTDEDGAMDGDLDTTNDPLTIVGAGRDVTIINGGGATTNERAIHGHAPLELRSLTVTGSTDDLAAGVFTLAPLTADQISVSGNTSPGTGAGLLATGGLTLSNATLSNNTATDGLAGLYAASPTPVSLTNVIGSGNSADGNGAGLLFVSNDLISARNITAAGNETNDQIAGIYAISGIGGSVANATASGNRAANVGAGLIAGTNMGGTVSINNATVTGNVGNSDNSAQSGAYSGILVIGSGTVTVGNTVSSGNQVGANTTAPVGKDCFGNVESRGYNLFGDVTDCTFTGDTATNKIGVDPMLGPLGDNGGFVPTVPILKGSPAVNGGNPALPGSGGAACEAADARGLARNCDIGAYELTFCRKVAVNRIGTTGNDSLRG
ncbi:MAG: choice-of-anchor Q domain-containing protein, partial [Actinomycetota bacterium]